MGGHRAAQLSSGLPEAPLPACWPVEKLKRTGPAAHLVREFSSPPPRLRLHEEALTKITESSTILDDMGEHAERATILQSLGESGSRQSQEANLVGMMWSAVRPLHILT